MGRALPACAGLYAIAVAAGAVVLPERVPLHFGAGGEADRFGSRGEALLGFALLGVSMLGTWALLQVAIRRGSLALVNVPHPGYWKTPEREAELRRRVREDLDRLMAATFLLLVAVVAATAWAATDESGARLSWPFFLAFGGYLLWTALFMVHLATRRYRPEP